jgi:hypothetical protein
VSPDGASPCRSGRWRCCIPPRTVARRPPHARRPRRTPRHQPQANLIKPPRVHGTGCGIASTPT